MQVVRLPPRMHAMPSQKRAPRFFFTGAVCGAAVGVRKTVPGAGAPHFGQIMLPCKLGLPHFVQNFTLGCMACFLHLTILRQHLPPLIKIIHSSPGMWFHTPPQFFVPLIKVVFGSNWRAGSRLLVIAWLLLQLRVAAQCTLAWIPSVQSLSKQGQSNKMRC